MARCHISFTLVCLGACFIEILIIALEITSASTHAWVTVKYGDKLFSFGLFYGDITIGMTTIRMLEHSPLQTIRALLIFSVGFGIAASVFTVFSATQKTICGRGSKFFFIIAEISFLLASLIYLIGLSVFTHYWLRNPKSFFNPAPVSAEYNYGYSYWISWLAAMFQISLTVFLVIFVHFMMGERHRTGDGEAKETTEHTKLVDSAPSPIVEKAIVVTDDESGAAGIASTSHH